MKTQKSISEMTWDEILTLPSDRLKKGYIQGGEKVFLTEEKRDLGHGEQTKVFYADGSIGWYHTTDIEDIH